MPVLTIASAVSRISCSLTLQANLFQLFQPIGGVCANFGDGLFTGCATAVLLVTVTGDVRKTAIRALRMICISLFLYSSHGDCPMRIGA